MGGAINLVSKTGYDTGLIESRVEGGSYGFFKGWLATGQVYGPLDLYASFADTELQGYRDHSQQTRYRAFGTAGYILPGGTTLRLDLGFTHNEEQLPGALTPQQFEQNPQQQNPATRFAKEARNYNYGARRPHPAHAHRPEPGLRVVHPAQLPGPGPSAGLRRHR